MSTRVVVATANPAPLMTTLSARHVITATVLLCHEFTLWTRSAVRVTTLFEHPNLELCVVRALLGGVLIPPPLGVHAVAVFMAHPGDLAVVAKTLLARGAIHLTS